MQVAIKDFGVALEIKSRGIELEVSDAAGQQIGDLVVTMSKVIWCPGRTQRENGKALTWPKFIEMMEKTARPPRRRGRR